MSNVTVTSTFNDERAAWDAGIELERMGLDASQISVEPQGRPVPSPDVVGPRLARRAASAAVAGALVASAIGVLVAATLGGPWFVGAAFGAGLGALAGGYWGIATRLPVNVDLLDAADDDTSLVRVAVAAGHDTAPAVVEVLASADPVHPPRIER